MNDLTLEELREQIEALEASLGSASGMAAGFDLELRRMRSALADTGHDVRILERGFSRGLRGALDGVVFDGMRLSDALRDIGRSMVQSAYSSVVTPVTDHLGSMLAGGVSQVMQGLMPFANGGSFSNGRVQAFANGGVVNGPTTFPMRGGTGLMGEAGPEAIMPLTRGTDGKLGVRSEGGGQPVSIVFNISTPDAESFRRSQSQIAAQMNRALGRGQRNR